MRFELPQELALLSSYVPRFISLVGTDRWKKRMEQLEAEMHRSPCLWKIGSDYHWLELEVNEAFKAITETNQASETHAEATHPDTWDALRFAATVVETHDRLGTYGQTNLNGRLLDSLKAEGGFASLYLEISLADTMMRGGADVGFADMEGTDRFDLLLTRGGFKAEIECKSHSADAGRRIHRKDFYRFLDSLEGLTELGRAPDIDELFVVTLDNRLSANVGEQAELRSAIEGMAREPAAVHLHGKGFALERVLLDGKLAVQSRAEAVDLYSQLKARFGQNIHVSGMLNSGKGRAVVMRSLKQDDTSAPLLEAMRKASTQLTRKRPGYIAVQHHAIEAEDLMLPSVRRIAAILSYALYGHYGGGHVNAVVVSGYRATVHNDHTWGSPSFAIENPRPKRKAPPVHNALGLSCLADQEFADIIGSPLPAPNISRLSI